MILNVRYYNRAPEQIQNVRMYTLYMSQDASASPEIVIHSSAPWEMPQRNIPLSEIREIITYND